MIISLSLHVCRYPSTTFPYNFRTEKITVARTVHNAKLDTRSARVKCEIRREPHWQKISKGCFIGYRRIANGGTWVARMRDSGGRQHYEALGAADDIRDPDGLTVLSFGQAQEHARAWFTFKARELAGQTEPERGPFTVAAALEEYLTARERRGSKGVKKDRYSAEARIAPVFGNVEVSKLTARRIQDWLHGIARSPKLIHTRKFAKEQATVDFDADDYEAVRARRSTANRVLTVLKAALNHGFNEGRVGSDDAWRRVKPFREVDAAVVRYLSADECRRLVNACPSDFRALVQAALATGCRYGELIRMSVSDFNPEPGAVSVRLAKGGKVRHVALAGEGRALFTNLTAGRAARELIFRRSDGKAWGPSHQQRPLTEASRTALVDPAVTFHVLRHTYGSALAMKGVPMGVIAAQLGHSGTRMTEKHYAHLAPSYVADTVRASLPPLADFKPSNVVLIAGRS
jgi:integrase